MAYNKKTWTTEEVITALALNQMSDNIEYAPRSEATGLKIARGHGQITFTNQTIANVVITFSTDAEDGDPAFSATPHIVATESRTGTGSFFGDFINIREKTATSFKVSIGFDSGNVTGTADFDWIAIGPG